MGERSQVFLLRCWQEPEGEGIIIWRYSLAQINPPLEKKGFADLPTMLAYLEKILVANESDTSGEKPS